MSFSDQIAVSGLLNGNGSVSREFSVAAPTVIVVPVDSVVLDGTTIWENQFALYSVGSTVSVEDIMTMSATRDGAVPLATSASGYAENSGFIFVPGDFKIKP